MIWLYPRYITAGWPARHDTFPQMSTGFVTVRLRFRKCFRPLDL